MSTPHIQAQKEEVAKVVIMPGDPLRAKFIAETFLEDAVQFNEVRGMLGYTGTYQGKRVSVMGSGMGIPSMAIYSYELFKFYDVETIIRIGTCGSMDESLRIGDLVFAMGSSTNSSFASQYGISGTISAIADYELLEKAVNRARTAGISFKAGHVLSSDVFYDESGDNDKWEKLGILAAEMESYGLYLNAARLQKKALCILTVSDELKTGKKATAEERQTSFTDMMTVALDISAGF